MAYQINSIAIVPQANGAFVMYCKQGTTGETLAKVIKSDKFLNLKYNTIMAQATSTQPQSETQVTNTEAAAKVKAPKAPKKSKAEKQAELNPANAEAPAAPAAAPVVTEGTEVEGTEEKRAPRKLALDEVAAIRAEEAAHKAAGGETDAKFIKETAAKWGILKRTLKKLLADPTYLNKPKAEPKAKEEKPKKEKAPKAEAVAAPPAPVVNEEGETLATDSDLEAI